MIKKINKIYTLPTFNKILKKAKRKEKEYFSKTERSFFYSLQRDFKIPAQMILEGRMRYGK